MTAGFDGSNARVTPLPSMLVASTDTPSHATTPTERTIQSLVLGDTIIPAESLFTFPEGMHGFEAHTEFALVACGRPGFWWLQAADEPGLAFLLADPFTVLPGYEVDLGAGDEQFLELTSPDDALVLAVVTLPASKDGQATANLRGPLVFNTRAQLGRQIVSANEGYGFQVPVALR